MFNEKLDVSLANTKLNSQAFACLVFVKHNCLVDIENLRREKLRLWFASTPIPSKEKSYISQLLSGKCSFREKAARRLEETYSMGDMYLDTPIPGADEEKKDLILKLPHGMQIDKYRFLSEFAAKLHEMGEEEFRAIEALNNAGDAAFRAGIERRKKPRNKREGNSNK